MNTNKIILTILILLSASLFSCTLSSKSGLASSKNKELKPYQTSKDKTSKDQGKTTNVKIEEKPKTKASKEIQSLQTGSRKIEKNKTTKIAKTLPMEEVLTGAVEVTWLVPQEAVDGFVINYGFNEASLEKQVKIENDKLVKELDDQNGEVYKYILNDIPTDKPLYVKISAYKGDLKSEDSPVLHIK